MSEENKYHCLKGCSECCLNSSIEATILEFLPAAHELYITGHSEQVLDTLSKNNENRKCIFYNPFKGEGGCSMYENRGLICRLYGFAVRMDKNNNPQLISCKIIKNSLKQDLLGGSINQGPVNSKYYLKLYGIDPKLMIRHFPINEAIGKAIELVTFYYQFRKPRKAS